MTHGNEQHTSPLEDEPKWQTGNIGLGRGKTASYKLSDRGVYFFHVNTPEGNTIGNYVDVAIELSINKGTEVKFLFSGRYVMIDASNPDEPVRCEVPEGNEWLGKKIQEKLNPPDDKERAEFMWKWFLDNREAVADKLQYLVDIRSRRAYDNPAENEDNIEGVLQAAWDIRQFRDMPQGDNDIEVAKEIRGLASSFYESAAEKGAFFNDYDDALEFILQVLYGLAHNTNE